jgi:hypothetical protein
LKFHHPDHGLIKTLPAYIRPIVEARMYGGIPVAILHQGEQPRRKVPSKGPWIVLISDDTDRAVGPEGFHQASINDLFKHAGTAVLVACAPLPALYFAAATAATILRLNAVIIETRPEHELTWSALILRVRPDLPVLVGSTTVGNA